MPAARGSFPFLFLFLLLYRFAHGFVGFFVPYDSFRAEGAVHGITLTLRLYHAFWAEKGSGKVLIGEVSKVNDDNCDNRFYEDMGRFPIIEEDEAPYRLLCNEYPAAK